MASLEMRARKGHPLLSVLLFLAILEAAAPFRVIKTSETLLTLEDTPPREEIEMEDGAEAGLPIDNLRVIPTQEINMDEEDAPRAMEVAPEDIPGTTEMAEAGRAIDNFRDNFHQDPFTDKETRQGKQQYIRKSSFQTCMYCAVHLVLRALIFFLFIGGSPCCHKIALQAEEKHGLWMIHFNKVNTM
jgi:hypothetical protein